MYTVKKERLNVGTTTVKDLKTGKRYKLSIFKTYITKRYEDGSFESSSETEEYIYNTKPVEVISEGKYKLGDIVLTTLPS
jgi:hypothetical protein